MKKTLLALALSLTPTLALAQYDAGGGYSGGSSGITLGPVRSFIGAISYLETLLIPVLIGAAVIVFFWGLVVFLAKTDAKGASEGRKLMIWGIIAIFVMVSVWGIIGLAQSAFGIQGAQNVSFPGLPAVH